MTTYAFSPNHSTPADYTNLAAWQLSNLIADAGLGSHGTSAIASWDEATLNKHHAYPESRSGDAPDEWHVRDETNDTVGYRVQGNGEAYHTTLAYREMTYQEARRHARDIIENHYRAYSTSYFKAMQIWFPADQAAQADYLKTNAFIEFEEANSLPLSHVVMDVDGDMHRVTTRAEWDGFFVKWHNLDKTAEDIAETTWTDVKNATTTAEVKTIIETMLTDNPIPEPG